MVMKQTQTKMFDFADIGLDFSAGSKSLFPDRFKKMLAQGYNTQTVSSVTVEGNQVTLNYGGSHGYAADRVLKLNSPALVNINKGEFVIDSVTAQSVTLTIDNAPAAISGNFTTYVASLGYELVYEQANIHVYKFKALDESALYLRLCFQNQPARRNCISPCIGKSFDTATGNITDSDALIETASVQTPGPGMKWEYSFFADSSYDTYTYKQGEAMFGKGCIVGSPYHLFSLHSSAGDQGRVTGFAPTCTLDYAVLQYPVLIGESYANMGGNGLNFQGEAGRGYIGNIRVVFDLAPTNEGNALFTMPQANSSFLPISIDTFNTTTAAPVFCYEFTTKQLVGVIAAGMYVAKYAASNTPPPKSISSPSTTYDIDMNSKCLIHFISASYSTFNFVYLAFPVEEVKIA